MGPAGSPVNATWAADGKRLLFQCTAEQDTRTTELRLLDLVRGSSQLVHSSKEPVDSQALAPDGSVVYALVSAGATGGSLRAIPTAEGTATTLLEWKTRSNGGPVRVSPDGRVVVFGISKDGSPGDWDVWAIPSSWRNTDPVASGPARESVIDWTPDGTGLVVSEGRDITARLILVEWRDGRVGTCPAASRRYAGARSRGELESRSAGTLIARTGGGRQELIVRRIDWAAGRLAAQPGARHVDIVRRSVPGVVSGRDSIAFKAKRGDSTRGSTGGANGLVRSDRGLSGLDCVDGTAGVVR